MAWSSLQLIKKKMKTKEQDGVKWNNKVWEFMGAEKSMNVFRQEGKVKGI